MDQDKARDFFEQPVMDNGAELSALLGASPIDEWLQEGLQRIGQVVQTLRTAAAEIDPLLTVEVDQVPANDSACHTRDRSVVLGSASRTVLAAMPLPVPRPIPLRPCGPPRAARPAAPEPALPAARHCPWRLRAG